jgi:Zn-finger nucleic acid-binding protein
MNCPVCKDVSLNTITLESDLPAVACDECGGNWISASKYWAWLENHGPALAEKQPEGEPIAATDVQHAKICPECRRLMLRYQIGHGLDFALDQCGSCNGVWFDKNEWEALKQRNLHDEVHLIFTAPWQTQVRKDERRRHLETIYARQFQGDYAEIKRIKEWVDAHPEKSRILAFFNDPDPYSS